jgi:alpha-glucosidase
MLHFFRALTNLRRAEPPLSVGAYASVDTSADDVFAYARTAPGVDRFLIVLSFAAQAHVLDLTGVAASASIALSTSMVRHSAVDLSAMALGANEGLVLRLD